jgi:hypothetical protein
MSFSVEFHAATKAAARANVAKASVPDEVRSFLLTSIDALDAATEDRPRVIFVKAVGHLSEGPGSYNQSTAHIEVRPISLAI